MNYILFDQGRQQLYPFTHTRPVADIRCGILTMRERWELCLGQATGTLTEDYLQPLYPSAPGVDNYYINAAVTGNQDLAQAINELGEGRKLLHAGSIIAARTSAAATLEELDSLIKDCTAVEYVNDILAINNVWDIFAHNDRAIREDFALVTAGRESAAIPDGVIATGKEHIFIEDGAKILPGCIINAVAGPVYIGKDAEVMEGSLVRGPLALCTHAVLKMGAKIYGATTIGPGCKVGGEVNNTVFFANSNKGHDGYLGNAVIGEWCNLGADTNCSNLKNNYDEVKIWSEQENKLVRTGLTFCGLIMGDHSKCGINTMFNTGTVVGVSANIFGAGFPDKYVPSFSWGGASDMVTYEFDKAMETADRMMGRRGLKLTDAERVMYRHLFDNRKQ